MQQPHTYQYKEVCRRCNEVGFVPNITLCTSQLKTIKQLVANGMGISILPSYITLPVGNDRRIVAIPYESDILVEYAAISLKENENPALNKMQQFLQDLQKEHM